jgi:hypothetical protein
VRKSVTFEGPVAGVAGWGFTDDESLRVLDRRLRDLARDELLVDASILGEADSLGAAIT